MFIGIILELEDGQESRIRFTQTTDSGAIAHCEASNDTRTRTVLLQAVPSPAGIHSPISPRRIRHHRQARTCRTGPP